MRILGIDPGTATTGYGFINSNKKAVTILDFGWIKTEKNGQPGKRLLKIYKETLALLRKNTPDVVAIERLFFYANAKTVMQVGQAHGVLLLAAARSHVPVFEYAPAQIKRTVTGSGRADKDVIKKVIRKVFNVRAPNRKKTHFDDVADAIAVALCHAKISSGSSLKGGEMKSA